ICTVARRDRRGVVQGMCERVNRQGPAGQGQYKGYYVEYGGQFQSAEETSRLLTILGIAVVIGIGFLLHLVFRSARDALLVMVNLPLALIGGVAGGDPLGGGLSRASPLGFFTGVRLAGPHAVLVWSP